jgi:hypothetical protein
VVFLSLTPGKQTELPDGIACSAAFAVMRFDNEGKLGQAFVTGGEVSWGTWRLQAHDLQGNVEQVLPDKHEVVVNLRGNIGGEDLLHRLILFRAGEHQAEYEIFRAGREGKRWRMWLGDYEFLRGRALVGEIDEAQRTVRTPTVLALDAVAPVQGMAVSNEARTAWWRLKSTRRGEVALDGDAPLTSLRADADGDGRAVLLVWDFGAGDNVLIPGQADYRR